MAMGTHFILILGCFCILMKYNSVFVHGIVNHDAEVQLKADLFKNYSKEVLPPHGDTPVVIQLGVSLISIVDVDPKRQSLTTQAWLKMQWKDSRLKFDETNYNGINVIRLPSHYIWHPDIKLYNSAKPPDMDVSDSNVNVLIYPDGVVVWIPPATFVTNCQLDFKYYPYDSHECYYKFGSWTFDGTFIHLELYGNKSEVDLSDLWNAGSEWEVTGSRALATIKKYACCTEPYPDVSFFILIQRRSPFYKATILCPVVAVACLIMISFWMSPAAYEKIMINVVAFLTLVLILLYLGNKLPAVGGNVPLIMNFCAVLLFLSVIIMAANIWVRSFIASRSHQVIPHWVNSLLDSNLAKLFCISTMVPFEFMNSSDDPAIFVGDDESKRHSVSPTQKKSHWIPFFQLIDRISFILFLIIISSLLLAVAS